MVLVFSKQLFNWFLSLQLISNKGQYPELKNNKI
jgi:hypothetical protein